MGPESVTITDMDSVKAPASTPARLSAETGLEARWVGWRRAGTSWWRSLVLAVVLCLVSACGALAGPVLTTVGPPATTRPSPFSVAFSPDGKLLATADLGENKVSVFSVAAGGTLIRVGSGETGVYPRSVAFSPNRKFLATANRNSNSVSVFSVAADGALDQVGLPTQTGTDSHPVSHPVAVAFSPDGTLLATANSDDNSVSVFSVAADGALAQVGLPTQTGTDSHPVAVAFSHDGGLLATADMRGNSVSVFSVSADGTLALVDRTERTVRSPISVAFSSKGLLATANLGTVSVFKVSVSGGLDPVDSRTSTDRTPQSVAFSPDGGLLATADYNDDTTSVFSVSEGGTLTPVRSPTPTGDGPRSTAFSPAGRAFLATVNSDSTVSMFSVSAHGALTRVGSPTPTEPRPESVAFDRSGKLLATANADGNSVSVFSMAADGMLTPVGSPERTGRSPFSVAFGRNGELLATANLNDESVSVFTVAADGALTRVEPPTQTGSHPVSVAFSPDGTLLAAASSDDDWVSVFLVAPDGALSLVGSRTRTGAHPRSVAFSPDGKLLATANLDPSSVSVYSVAAGGTLTQVGDRKGTGAFPVSVAFSPDGKLLATANSHGDSVSVFSVADGALTPVAPLAGTVTGSFPYSVAFSPDGGLLATANEGDDSMSLFLVSAGGALTRVGSPTPTVDGPRSVAFSPNGAFLTTANAGRNSVSVYPLAAPVLDASITSTIPAAIADRKAELAFDANYPSTFECRLDSGSFAPCVTPVSYSGLSEGAHTFSVRAKDLVGNLADSPSSRSWTVDLTPPVAAALAQPADATGNLSASPMFSWSPTTDTATGIGRYELWIDGAHSRTVSPQLCGAQCSATPGAPLTDGPHRWQVRAVDGVDNVAEGTSRNFTVDAAPPSPFTLAGPLEDAATTDRRPALSWQATSDGGIGLAGYDVLLDGQVAASVGAPATAFTPDADLAEGAHDWQVVARDAYGNRRASQIHHFSIDVTPPIARLTAAPNPALAGRIVALDGAGSSDAGTGIVRYEWDLDGDGAFERDTGATATTAQTFVDPGTFAVQLRVSDRAGLSAVARIDQRITAENRGSEQPGISVNDGSQWTNDPKVTIRATWPSFASRMLISNDGGFKTAQRSAVQTDTPWTLDSAGSERLPKTVYVRFVRGTTVSETYTDDIILDQSAPSVTSARVSPGPRAGAVLLALRARDRGLAGVANVQVSNNRRHPRAGFRSYRSTVTLTRRKGERQLKIGRPMYVRVRDHAGNLSAWRTAQRATKRSGRTSRR